MIMIATINDYDDGRYDQPFDYDNLSKKLLNFVKFIIFQ